MKLRAIAPLTIVASLATSLLAATPMEAQAGAPGSDLPKVSAELEKVRAALEKYEDPVVAVHDGYFSTLGCVQYSSPAGPGDVPTYTHAGGMGVHFLNTALAGPTVDPMKPQILLYEPVGGELRLAAAEWFVPLSTGVKERPRLFGQAFDGPMHGHHPLMPVELDHYDLHVWLWKANPAGLFSPTNPDVKCPPGKYTVTEHAPKLLKEP
jgi:hypothetical protein